MGLPLDYEAAKAGRDKLHKDAVAAANAAAEKDPLVKPDAGLAALKARAKATVQAATDNAPVGKPAKKAKGK